MGGCAPRRAGELALVPGVNVKGRARSHFLISRLLRYISVSLYHRISSISDIEILIFDRCRENSPDLPFKESKVESREHVNSFNTSQKDEDRV